MLPAFAAATPSDVEPSVTAAAAADAPPVATVEYRQDFRGVFLHGTYVLDTWGKGIPLQLGAQWAGIRTFGERSWLLTFDGAANLFAAYGGNSSGRFYLLGGQARVLGEWGRRFSSASDTSLYAGGTVALDGNAVPVLGVSPDQYNLKNDLSGIAGLYGSAGLRLNAGLSHLRGDRALLVTAFVAELVRAGQPGVGPAVHRLRRARSSTS